MANSAALYIRRAKGNGERLGMSAIERVEVKTNRHAVRDGKFFFATCIGVSPLFLTL